MSLSSWEENKNINKRKKNKHTKSSLWKCSK